MTTPTITTTHNPPPIPLRCFDWSATLADYDEGDPVGYGATEAEAVEDLKEQMEDRGDGR